MDFSSYGGILTFLPPQSYFSITGPELPAKGTKFSIHTTSIGFCLDLTHSLDPLLSSSRPVPLRDKTKRVFLKLVRYNLTSKKIVLGYMCLFELWFSQGVCPVVELLGHMLVLFLI